MSAFHAAGAECKGRCPYEDGCGACPKPRQPGNSHCFLQSVLPPAGKAGYGEIRPCRGRGCAFPSRERVTKGIALATRLVLRARSPACLAMTFAFFKVFCLRRGRRVLLGAAAPRSTPFQPPPTTPLGFPGGHCSHGSVGSWEEPTRTTLARKGRYEGMPVEPRPARRRAVRIRAASGDEPWANGALGKG